MGFFKSYDNVDNAVNRAYGRWAKWIWGSLLALILAEVVNKNWPQF
ncbi:hypothetical protein [Hafnia alvei]|nr:hypothetical protein [Hafnia alvei]NLS52620.1 hypothetical protein [Hafnia alvei]